MTAPVPPEASPVACMRPEEFERHLREFARRNPGEFERMLREMVRRQGRPILQGSPI